MTTYAPNFTPRVRLKYLAAGIEHTVQGRGARGDSSGVTEAKKTVIRDVFAQFITRLAADFTWITAEIALTDSDVWNPVPLPDPIVGTKLVADFSLQQRATSTNFVGTSTDSRAAIYLYGLFWTVGKGTNADNGRVSAGEDAIVGTAAAALSANLRSGSGGLAAFHNYANIKVNDHLLKLLRRGTIV